MVKKIFIFGLLAVLASGYVFASDGPAPDEGMWLPIYLKKLNEKNMQAEGFKLTADDIYNINHSSMKDAVVCLNRGMCTAEIVSQDGLLLTNHHCGYDKIAEHSSPEHNYLDNGFWAKSRTEELPNENFTASILQYMEDVTDVVNNNPKVKNAKNDEARDNAIQDVKDSITAVAGKGGKLRAEVKEYYKGNEYYLVVYQEFKDVRLVGAPPSSIGKFGGDQDNWMWPRHTGDFSVFRIYADKDGNPAPYSKDNVPYHPKYFFPVSLKGEKQNDFAMVMGYPGHTDRYLTSYDLEFSRDYSNPAIIDAFGTQLSVMKRDMDADESVRIKLASDYASMSNTFKYYEGQELMLRHGAGFETKIKEEKAFAEWVNANPKRKEKYGSLLSDIKDKNDKLKTLEPALSYFFYGVFSSGVIKYSFNWFSFNKLMNEKRVPRARIDSMGTAIKPAVDEYFNSSVIATDKKVLAAVLYDLYNKIPADARPEALTKIVKDNKKAPNAEMAFEEYVDDLYKKSLMLDKDKAAKFLGHPNLRKLKNDPMYEFILSLVKYYFGNLNPVYSGTSDELADKHKLYMEALMDFQPDKVFYPDANSTLRVTYGQVLPYIPRDAVRYKYYTTYEGILQKYNPKDPEFAVPQHELDLLNHKDFGRYAQNDTLRVCFLANTDITGGNSGSPVLNANGELIGLAFDGDWESMIGDLVFNPATNRTICVDIRYVLWVMDKYAGAGNLVNEMKIVDK